mgnify:CR=1 FL=1
MSAEIKYPTDLSDAPWRVIEPLLPKPRWRPGGPGRPPYPLRQEFNGIL